MQQAGVSVATPSICSLRPGSCEPSAGHRPVRGVRRHRPPSSDARRTRTVPPRPRGAGARRRSGRGRRGRRVDPHPGTPGAMPTFSCNYTALNKFGTEPITEAGGVRSSGGVSTGNYIPGLPSYYPVNMENCAADTILAITSSPQAAQGLSTRRGPATAPMSSADRCHHAGRMCTQNAASVPRLRVRHRTLGGPRRNRAHSRARRISWSGCPISASKVTATACCPQGRRARLTQERSPYRCDCSHESRGGGRNSARLARHVGH